MFEEVFGAFMAQYGFEIFRFKGVGTHLAATSPALSADTRAPCWQAFDEVDLQAELRCPVPTIQDVPAFMRDAVHAALVLALRAIQRNSEPCFRGLEALRAWKVFMLAPRMLLARCGQQGRIGRGRVT